MDEKDYRVAKVFKAVSNGIRLEMLILLDEKDHYVGQLIDKLNRSQTSVSRHLRWLKVVNLIKGETEGKHVRYSIKRPKLVKKILELRNYLRREFDEEDEKDEE